MRVTVLHGRGGGKGRRVATARSVVSATRGAARDARTTILRFAAGALQASGAIVVPAISRGGA